MTEQGRLIITTLTAAIHQKKFTSSIYLGHKRKESVDQIFYKTLVICACRFRLTFLKNYGNWGTTMSVKLSKDIS